MAHRERGAAPVFTERSVAEPTILKYDCAITWTGHNFLRERMSGGPMPLATLKDLCNRQEAALERDDLSRDALLDIATILLLTVWQAQQIAVEEVVGHAVAYDETALALCRADAYLSWVRIQAQTAPEPELAARLRTAGAHVVTALRLLQNGS